jgi:hypothetical protein
MHTMGHCPGILRLHPQRPCALRALRLPLCVAHGLCCFCPCRSVKQQLAEHHPELYQQLQQELSSVPD